MEEEAAASMDWLPEPDWPCVCQSWKSELSVLGLAPQGLSCSV